LAERLRNCGKAPSSFPLCLCRMEGKYYWLICVPKKASKGDVFEELSRKVQDVVTEIHKFNIPELKVGTLDMLMQLSDDLNKVDNYVEQVTRKIAKQLFEVMENKPEKFNIPIIDTNADEYVTKFKWDDARFPRRKSLRELTDFIHTQVSKLDDELRAKVLEYNTLNQTIHAQEKKESGTLVARDLSSLINPEDIVETENLTTLFVVVPRTEYKEWERKYETLAKFVVPRSSKKISEDSESGLFSVVLFKRSADDFRNAAREHKFIVRKYDPTQALDPEAKKKQISERDRLKKALLRWCKTNFTESFVAWIHLKCIRCFVEAILRYGLPAEFQASLLMPKKKQEKKLRDILLRLYEHVGRNLSNEDDSQVSATLGVSATEKYYPYVSLDINLDMTPNLF